MTIVQYNCDKFYDFTDREQVLQLFDQSLRSAQPEQFQLLAIKGNSGTGKSFLIDYLIECVCPGLGWRTGHISFTQSGVPDFRFILNKLEDTLKGCVPHESLIRYRDKRDGYLQSFKDEIKINIQQSADASNQSSVSAVTQNVQVNAQMHERELALRSNLSRALTELAEENKYSLCVFIDGYERLVEPGSSELASWLWGEIVPALVDATPLPLLIMTCGWEWPSDAAIARFIRQAELTDFDLAQVRSYLKKLQVITSTIEPLLPEQEKLVSAFYDLTKGHPLILGLAVTYFKGLSSDQQTAASLQTNTLLKDEQARVGFLQHRLLDRLPEPYRTLLERGPILRSFDQTTLQALLSVETGNTTPEANTLDDRMYAHFCGYPFIIQRSGPGSDYGFHSLVRRVGLEALRLLPQTKEKLHRKMVDYYKQLADDEQNQGAAFLDRQVEESGAGFKAELERFYHALQVKELQADAFKEWEVLTEQAIALLRPRQFGPLMELVHQLSEEGESFLGKDSFAYGRYLVLSANSLQSEFRYEEALILLKEAAKVFKPEDHPLPLADCLGLMGGIYHFQGKMQQALDCYEQALPLAKQGNDSIIITQLLQAIGSLYQQQGDLDQYLDYYEQALSYFDQAGNTAAKAEFLNAMGFLCLQQGNLERSLSYYQQLLPLSEKIRNPATQAQLFTNIGFIYQQHGKWEQALEYFKKALPMFEQIGDPYGRATCLNNMGFIYQAQGMFDEALSHFESAVASLEKGRSNPATIAQFLNNMGTICQQQGKWDQAANYFEQALPLWEKSNDPAVTARLLNNIASIYQQQKKWEQALSYSERALPVIQQLGSPSEIAVCFENIGSIYQFQGRWEQALSIFEQALPFYATTTAQLLNNIGSIYQQQAQWEQTLNYYERALPLFEIAGDPTAIAQLLNNIGSIYKQQELWEQTIEPYAQALTIYEQLGNDYKFQAANVAEQLATCYEQLGEHENSAAYQERAKQLREDM